MMLVLKTHSNKWNDLEEGAVLQIFFFLKYIYFLFLQNNCEGQADSGQNHIEAISTLLNQIKQILFLWSNLK